MTWTWTTYRSVYSINIATHRKGKLDCSALPDSACFARAYVDPALEFLHGIHLLDRRGAAVDPKAATLASRCILPCDWVVRGLPDQIAPTPKSIIAIGFNISAQQLALEWLTREPGFATGVLMRIQSNVLVLFLIACVTRVGIACAGVDVIDAHARDRKSVV